MLAKQTFIDDRLMADDSHLRGLRAAFADEARAAPADASAPQPQDAPTAAVTASGVADVDAILIGSKWAVSSLTYSFPSKGGQYEPGYSVPDEPHSGFAPLTAAFKGAIEDAYEGAGTHYGSYESFLGLDFTKVAGGAGDLRSAFSTDPAVAYAYYPSTLPTGGDSWFNKAYMESFDAPQVGNYTYLTVMHELGHALGLQHGHETSGGISGAVSADRDSLEFTVMTYRSYVGASTTTGYVNGDWDLPQTPMMLDIAALQWMYGADYTLNSGATTYTWDAATGQTFINGVGQAASGDNRVFLTIWDGGGKDTYDMSNYGTGVNIDLNPGKWSITSEDQLAVLDFYEAVQDEFARGNVFNALQFGGSKASLIENAIGGAGKDKLTGNTVANSLDGGGGADNLKGGKGGDTLTGGAGKDQFTGGIGNDTFDFNDISDSTNAASDLILDLEDGDIIDLSTIDAKTGAGNDAFTLVAAFTNHKGEAVLTYDVGTDRTSLELDTDGDGAANGTILIKGDHTDHTNFVL